MPCGHEHVHTRKIAPDSRRGKLLENDPHDIGEVGQTPATFVAACQITRVRLDDACAALAQQRKVFLGRRMEPIFVSARFINNFFNNLSCIFQGQLL